MSISYAWQEYKIHLMSPKDFFKTIRDSIHQIVSGDEKSGPPAGEKQRHQSAQNEIESAVIVLATEVMRLDGNFSSETKKILTNFLDKNFGKGNITKRNKLINDYLSIGSQPYTKMACEQLKTLATYTSNLEIIILLYEIATTDDFIKIKENNVIQKIAKYLQISVEELKKIKEKFSRINDPFIILEMEETVSVVKVKAAYRKMALKYHPDKRVDGASEEEANKKFRDIKKAYELIIKKLSN
jgi:DnaJ like chaperone protein